MPFDAKRAELTELLTRLCDGDIDQADMDRLEALLIDDPASQDLYRRYMALDVELAWRAAGRPAPSQFEPPVSVPFPTVVLPSASTFGSSASSFSGFLFSYVMAAVIVSVGMLIGWMCQAPLGQPVANNVPHRATTPLRPVPEMVFVARVTGMVDCQWSDPKTEPFNGAYVPLGKKYALASGLMEITYDTGAKVILQGPCTYEVQSGVGGYLSLGRLTARVETKGEGGRRKVEESRASHRINNTERAERTSAFPLPPSPLFFVRTPTAVVTDLGTEFGVEVSKAGVTEMRVFLGKVKIEGQAASGNAIERTLLSGQAVQLDPKKGLVDVSISKNKDGTFVRKMPTPKPSPLELIAQLDYSDTWSANSPTRAGSYLMLTTPESLRVEQCFGNPQRTWVFSRTSAMTTWPYDDSPVIWPGFHVRGSRSGFTETGDGGSCYFGFEYGLRDDFVVQFDAVQSEDRINITIGNKPATIDDEGSLSVMFRPAGAKLPEIGVFTPSKGEANTGIRSGISTAMQWHNYAVRFNLRDKQLTVWVDEKRRGTIDLAVINKGMPGGGSWAGLPWTAKCVTVGGSSEKANSRLWTDNFRVGSPRLRTSASNGAK